MGRTARRGCAALSAQYDDIAAAYSRTKTAPLRQHVEAYSFFRMLGDVRGLEVLDLACGDGFYTRQLATAGAKRVTGVDVSAEMIALARAAEAEQPLGIDYLCADVAQMEPRDPVDVVTAAYLLHYAPTVAALEAMCTRIATQLRPGGRFVAINENPEEPGDRRVAYSPYGFDKVLQGSRNDGSAIEYAMVSGRSMLRFKVWYYSRATYEQALHRAGFRSVQWRGLELSDAGVQELGAEYWQDYMAHPPVIGLECSL